MRYRTYQEYLAIATQIVADEIANGETLPERKDAAISAYVRWLRNLDESR